MIEENTTLGTHWGTCPRCDGHRNCDELALHKEWYWEDETLADRVFVVDRILKCRGCQSNFFQRTRYVEGAPDELDEVDEWPAPPKREVPRWFDPQRVKDVDLRALILDTYRAIDNDLDVLAAIGVRTAFDRASELLGVDPSATFQDKLSELFKQGKIGEEEKDVLAVLIDAASAAAHRGWRPTKEELGTMMSLLEHFVYRNFILKQQVDTLKTSVPPKPKKKP